MVNKTLAEISAVLNMQAQVLAAPVVTAEQTRSYYKVLDAQRKVALEQNEKDWQEFQEELANA